MKTWLATIKNKGLDFAPTTRALFVDYLSQHDGEQLEIRARKIRKSVSRELRGYYYGAILPFIQTLDENFKRYSVDELHQIMKVEFNGFQLWNPIKKEVVTIAKSAMNNEQKTDDAFIFIEKIRRWVAENYGQELPDPEEYKALRDRHFEEPIKKIEYPQESFDPDFDVIKK